MNEFKYLSYHTEYSCVGSYKRKMSVSACFSEIFSRVRDNSDIIYKVLVYPGTDLCTEKHYSNACLLSKHEVRNHLRQLRSIYPFGYRVLEKFRDDGQMYYEVMLHLKGVPVTFHKYVLTWLRYTYEYPYNVILRDAYMLKKDPAFRFESISNIFNVVSNCCPDYVGEGHSVSEDSIHDPIKKEELREQIRRVDRLNSIYKILSLKKFKLPEELRDFDCKDLEYWSPELFELRKPIYMKMYNAIKKSKKK